MQPKKNEKADLSVGSLFEASTAVFVGAYDTGSSVACLNDRAQVSVGAFACKPVLLGLPML